MIADAGIDDDPPSRRLDDEHVFAQLQGLIIAIRNIRNEYKVDPRKAISISIAAPDDATRQILANKSVIENLALCKLLEVSPDLPCPPYCARSTASTCDIYAHDLVNATADEQRLAAAAGSSGVVGTMTGNWRAPSL